MWRSLANGRWKSGFGLGARATPNRMGKRGDNDSNSARSRTSRYLDDDSRPSPIPLEECPWCGKKFSKNSFQLKPNSDHPTDLRVSCVNRECKFGRGIPLPIVTVDEPIYRRLPMLHDRHGRQVCGPALDWECGSVLRVASNGTTCRDSTALVIQCSATKCRLIAYSLPI